MVQKASADLTAMMNQAIAGELQAIVQYVASYHGKGNEFSFIDGCF